MFRSTTVIREHVLHLAKVIYNFSRVHPKIYVVHTPTNTLFIKLGKVLKFTLKYTFISLLHVSVYDRYQGACTAPG